MSASLGHCTDTSGSLVDIDSEHSSSRDSTTPLISSDANQQLHQVAASFQQHHQQQQRDATAAGRAPFLLPAQLYKSLLATAVLGNKERSALSRSLLFPSTTRNEHRNSPATEVNERTSKIFFNISSSAPLVLGQMVTAWCCELLSVTM